MNKQNMNNPHPSIFQTITPQLSAQLQAHSQWLESVCFLNKLNGPEISLSLSNNHLIIFTYKNRTRQHLYQAQLSFDTKFEIIYQLDGHSPPEEAVYSKPIGFRITKDNTHKVEIYPKCKSITPLWIKHLSRCINQQGFHRHFKLIKKVGKGGFANVYEVKRVTDKKHFAVKAFSKQTTLLSTDIQTKLNLLNEITMLRTFDSPHLIKCEAVYQSENSIYIVLQLLSHGQLHDRINKTQAIFSLSETRQFIKGMALGLKQMHEHRVMHRDIKPENIMLRGNEGVVPVICDFGLSSNVDEQDYLFYKCGTPGYVAPEITTISKGQHIEPQCDIFSLGCILHLMLVQRPLFQGKKASQVYQNNRKLKIDWSSQVYKKVDNEALDLLRRMLKIDPTDRIKASEILNHPFLANLIEEQLKQPESARTESSAKSIV